MGSIRVGVVGTGALGSQHTRIYADMARVGLLQFSGVYDADSTRAAAIAEKFGVTVAESMEALADRCDALSVVTPTVTHHEIASTLLAQGKSLLIEKPITDSTETARALVELAKSQGVVLQVGHVERFNPVYGYLKEAASAPKFIEAHRLSPFPGRGADVGVVLDLMIHDLDIVLAFVAAPVVDVDASGIRVLSDFEDIANARIKFANGCVANVTASRVSAERMRKIRVFSGGGHPAYVSLDYREQHGEIYRLATDEERESSWFDKLFRRRDRKIVSAYRGVRIVREPAPLEKEEPLRNELRSFVKCVERREAPVVSGEAGSQALELALEIARQIQERGPDQ